MKVIKEKVDSSSFLMLEGSNSVLAAGPNAVGVNRDAGVFINGPVSFSSPIDNIKFSGLFKFNPITVSGLPSTMVTPIGVPFPFTLCSFYNFCVLFLQSLNGFTVSRSRSLRCPLNLFL